MHILLTNDDGVLAPSLWALRDALQELGEVTVVAPLAEQSGVGHAITYRTPIRAERVRVEGGTVAYAVSGTPADCVKFGVLKLLSRPPDLVVSGINAGFNLGCNVFYSGTVAAVIEGAMYGVRGVAFSCSPHNADRIARMAAQAVRTLKVILEHRGRPALAYNVNLPALGDDDPEIVFTHHWAEAFHERYLPQDAGGVEGFRLDLRGEDQVSPGDGCDVLAIQAGKISVTPLRASLTDYDTLRHLAPPTPG